MANVIFSNSEDTAANIAANKRALLIAFDSTNKKLKYFDASTTEYEALTLDSTGTPTRSIGALTTAALTSVGNIDIGADSSNKLIIQPTLCYLLAGGEKIIDYLQANAIIDINAGAANIDTQINGTSAALLYADASTNRIGIGTNVPSEKLHISAAAASYMKIGFTPDSLGVIGGLKFTVAGSETARIEAERTVSSGRGSVLKFLTGNSTAITERLRIDDTGGIQINDSGAAVDVRIEGDTDANLLVTDGSADKVGIGVAAPAEKLEVSTSAAAKSAIKISGGVGGENNGGLILNDTFDFRSSAIIGNVIFNAKRGMGGSEAEFARIAVSVNSNATGAFESYMSFRVANAAGVVGSRMVVRHNKIDVYEDIYLESGNTIRDASGNDILMHGYGEIYVNDGSTAQSIPTGTTYTKLTGFAANGEFDNVAVTADYANDKIIIKKSGKYLINGSCSFTSGTNSVVFRAALFSGGTEKGNVHWARKVGTGSDVGSASFCGIVDVDVSGGNVDLDMRIRHDQAGNINFTPMYMNVTVTEIR